MMQLLALPLLPLALLAAPAPPVVVTITSPPAGYAAFGQVTVAAEVKAAERIRRVVFFVDDRQVGALTTPPFSVAADLGQENVEHRFRVVAYLASGATGEATLVTPKIAVDQEVRFDLQQLYVSARRDGKQVVDLQREDFKVVDGGEDQEITAFARGDIPFAAVVLLDSSLSMQGERLAAALAGAQAFISGMRPLDEVKLIDYCDHTITTTPFTSVPEVLTAGLGSINAHGGTALSDHLYLALKLLEERQGRRVVILLSDGVDSHSSLSMLEVLFKARQSQALIYWIRLEDVPLNPKTEQELPSLYSAWHDKDWYREHLRLLRRAVDESGGTITSVRKLEEIRPAFRGILEELREQYVLGYYPKDLRHDGSWRKVKVKMDRSGVRLLTREGYLDF
jgi:Ca-activated chloride channel family protein